MNLLINKRPTAPIVILLALLVAVSSTLGWRALSSTEQEIAPASSSVEQPEELSADAIENIEYCASLELPAQATLLFVSDLAETLDYPNQDIALEFIDYLKCNPDTTARIVGHTASTGNAEAELTLSGSRADLVANYVIDQGVDPKQVETQSKGATDLVAEPASAENRRVVIEVIE